ncbi:MAG: MFS transporter [Thermodesulfobacteriota bacterium]
MQRSYLAALRDLPAPPRLFLLFTAINVFSWQCIAGQALVLFARAIAMPPAWVGVLLSFMPASMVLVAFSVPLVDRLGPRRLLISTWFARNALAMSAFLLPWAVEHWGQEAGWYVLLFAILSFSVVRALGVGAWYPWLHEIVPREQLGSYFSIETAMGQAIAIVISFGMARLLAMGDGLWRFFVIHGAGIAAGLFSVLFIRRIPGGAGLAPGGHVRPGLRTALADSAYRRFWLLAMLGLATLMGLNAASVMYLRDILGYSDGRIMLLVALSGVGVAFSVRFWGRAADGIGSVPAMIQLLAGHALFSLCWCLLVPGWPLSQTLVVLVLLCTTVFHAAFAMVSARGMLCRVREEERVAYTGLWIVGMAVASGVPPVLVGMLIELLGLTGFRLCFLTAGLIGFVAVGLMFRLAPEEGKPALGQLEWLMPLQRPWRFWSAVFRISAGMGEKFCRAGGEGERRE